MTMAPQETNGQAPLSSAEIEVIAARLEAGQYLDDHYRSRVFRRPPRHRAIVRVLNDWSQPLSSTTKKVRGRQESCQ